MFKIKYLIRSVFRFYYSYIVKSKASSYEGKVKANFKTKVTNNTYLGHNFNSNGLVIYGKGKVVIGDNFHCGSGCVIMTENHNINGAAVPYDETYIVKDVVIGDNVWLGACVTLLPGVVVGEGVVIQANSTVVSDVDALAIVGGHPAKVFSSRNSNHYYKLKSEGKFH